LANYVTLYDTFKIAIGEPVAIKLADGHEKPFKLGWLMDKVTRQTSQTRMLAEFNASNSGTIVNGRVYPGTKVRASVRYWLYPYPKPLVDRHPSEGLLGGDSEPKTLGRARSATFIQTMEESVFADDWKHPGVEDKGSGFTRVGTSVSDRDAIQEIIDERFLTVSMGARSPLLACSICGKNWVIDRCEHRPGEEYEVDGESRGMYLVSGMLYYDHLARTAFPAQPNSVVLGYALEDSDTLFKPEACDRAMLALSLIDDRDGIMDIVLGEKRTHDSPADKWTDNDWAEAYILTSLADKGLLVDSALDAAMPIVEAFRTSERKPDYGHARFQIGPCGAIPLHDTLTAQAAAKVADRVKCADASSLRSRISECMNQMEGGSSMSLDPGKEWEGVDTKADALTPEESLNWSDFDGDIISLSYEEAEAEGHGAKVGILAMDKALTAKARNALPDSAFCGPGRSFPAHDAAHVRNGLSRLPQSNYSPEQKSRILACLKRKAKSLGVDVSSDSLKYDALCEAWERKTDDVDLGDRNPPPEDETDANKIRRLEKQLDAAKGKIQEQDGQISHLVDQLQNTQGNLRRMLADKVVALKDKLGKLPKEPDKRAEYIEKLKLRTTDSLYDTINDSTAEAASADLGSEDQVDDPTLSDDDTKPKKGPPKAGTSGKERASAKVAEVMNK